MFGLAAVTEPILPTDGIALGAPPLSGTSQSWPPEEFPSRTITLFASYQLSAWGSPMPEPMGTTVCPSDVSPPLRTMATSCTWSFCSWSLLTIMTARTPSGATWNEVTAGPGRDRETGVAESLPGGSSQTLPPAAIQRSPCASQLSDVQGPGDERHSLSASLWVRSQA